MNRRHRLFRPLAAGLVAFLAAGAAGAAPSEAGPSGSGHASADSRDQCFDITQRTNTIALNDHTILIRATGGVYEVETERCPELGRKAPRIDMIVQGSSYVCGRADYRLEVGEMGYPGPMFPCMIHSQRRLTPAELEAIPPNARP